MTKIKDLFLLDFSIHNLNHGSFGACPKSIFIDYQHWQREFERSPVQFMIKTGEEQQQKSKEELAGYVGCDPDDMVFTMNPSYALNIITKSLDLQPGDEILSTDHEYGALIKTWDYYCDKAGAKFVQQPITLPVQSREQIIEDFWKGYSKNTKAIFISHITSATGMIFPVKEICDRAKELGLMTIVDGAHVPGHIPLNIKELNPEVYTGACHKWLLTPKGSSFLYVKKELQHRFDPLVISWGYEPNHNGPSQFVDYHQLQGTRDFSAFLTMPAALQFRKDHNWDQVCADSRKMAGDNAQRIADALGTSLLSPVSEEFLGQMVSFSIDTPDAMKLKEILFNEYRIEIPVFEYKGKVYIRYSTQGYIGQSDMDHLHDSLKELVQKGMITPKN